MAIAKQKIMPCLWFDTEGEAAAKHYTSIFKNSKIGEIGRYGNEGKEITGKEAGAVMTVEFELEGQKFLALNGGPHFKFNEAVSFQIFCDTQDEVDYFWSRLTDGGKEQPCGWLKDKFGMSWQVVPKLLSSGDPAKADRVMKEVFKMKKIDIATLQKAAAGLKARPSTLVQQGESHASPALPHVQRPLRRGDRVL